MNNNWDLEVDFLVAGSGVAGLSAAITASRNGLEVVVVESEAKWGGTTCVSGGGFWMPNNPLMHRDGAQDSFEEALAYMEATVGDVGPHTSPKRKRAFLMAIPNYVNMLTEEGVRWVRAKDYPDYYPDIPGGKIGRCIEVKPFNMRKLKRFQRKSRMDESVPAPLKTDDVWLLGRAWSSPGGFIRASSFALRTAGGLLLGRQSRGLGTALAGSLMHIVMGRGIPVWLESPIIEIVLEGNRVVGALVKKGGTEVSVRTLRGVMLAAGGFARNSEWRKKYQGIEGWTAAPEGQMGAGIQIGMDAGGAVAMMDDAWWGAGVVIDHGRNGFVLGERSFPFSMIVDQRGYRYLNESESYVDFGHHMLAHDKETPAIPSWLVTDIRHSRRYLNTFTMMGQRHMKEAGEMLKSATLAGLAQDMGVDQDGFLRTVKRFNEFARKGVDRDFGRGRTAYDRYYGDPAVKPNPNLGPIEKGPFRAFKLYPGDLNTKGGLVTDEHARVLRADGSVISGLYASGNNSASVMGQTYPGPGSTIAPAGIFGFLGALHASRGTEK